MHTATSHHTEHGTAADADEPILSHQFDDVEQQSEASTLGMWLFLATEVMFFGGLLTAYAVYRISAPGGRSGEQTAQRNAWLHQYRRPVDEQSDHGPGGSCGTVASPSATGPVPDSDDGLGSRVPRDQRQRVYGRLS